MQCMFGLEHCTLARGQAMPIEGVYIYPLLLEAGWLPGGASLITCMKSGGFMQRGTKRGGAEGGEVQAALPITHLRAVILVVV